MIAESTLLVLALLYIGLLFIVALGAERMPHVGERSQALIYALSLSVYCSSWTFYGAVGSASQAAWSHAPIYLGPIALYLLAWPVLVRLVRVGSQQRVTSIADFLGARYGKSQQLAVLVTLVATATVLPYIALQLRALSQSWAIISSTGSDRQGDSALLAAAVMALFTLLFGTRRLDGNERHRGVMAAIAVESLVKLLAFVAVAGLACHYLVQRVTLTEMQRIAAPWARLELNPDFVAQVVISALAILCLPRQFHVTVVEYHGERDIRMSRWMFTGYLLAFLLLVVPISMAGQHLFAGAAINPDTLVQLLPMALGQEAVVVAAFLGGISAATGMVIVATVSLAIMITNELVAPALIRLHAYSPHGIIRLGDNLRRSRRLCIVAIFLLAWLVDLQLGQAAWLADIGFSSFLAAAQLGPALIAGLFWRRGHAVGAIAGISAGLAIWIYCAVLPLILPPHHALLWHGPLHIGWLRPQALFGVASDYPLAQATLWSLLLNTVIFVVISLLSRPGAAHRRQATLFLDPERSSDEFTQLDYSRSPIRVGLLQALLPQLLGYRQTSALWRQFETLYEQRLLPGDRAPQFVVERIEALLASFIGAASAHRAILRLEQGQQLEYRDLAGMVTDASRQNQFNRELLQTTVETVNQGISVVDQALNLVAWNKSYERLFDYPERFLYVGCPIERVYRYNAARGLMGDPAAPGDHDSLIERRLDLLYTGSPYRLERTLPNGRVVDIRGNPMPHGGFVTTYTDVTEYKDMLGQIEEARLALEHRLERGGRVLAETNARLRRENRLRAEAETKLREAHISKSRFMSATSHDLLQPINAARLFTAALKARQQGLADAQARELIDNIDDSLTNAETLIAALREIARLDSGRQPPRRQHFSAGPFLEQLAAEFRITAGTKGLQLRCRSSRRWLYSDPHLLRRILQNFLSNAVRYTASGKLLLGCRRSPLGLRIEVWDTGPGIPHSEHARIFSEFERLAAAGTATEEGLGLGLAIARRCADLLDHPMDLRSRQGSGTMFAITVPYGSPQQQKPRAAPDPDELELAGIAVLCIDNESAILEGMERLLGAWGCTAFCAHNRREAERVAQAPALILADYRLNARDTGIDVARDISARFGDDIPVVIISADDSESVRIRVRQAGYRFMAKPVNPGRLQALMRNLLTDRRRLQRHAARPAVP